MRHAPPFSLKKGAFSAVTGAEFAPYGEACSPHAPRAAILAQKPRTVIAECGRAGVAARRKGCPSIEGATMTQTYSTQMEAAKPGIVTPQMAQVAEDEGIDAEVNRERVARG